MPGGLPKNEGVKYSLQGRFIFLLAAVIIAAVCFAVWLTHIWDVWLIVIPLASIFALVAAISLVKGFFRPINDTLKALSSGVASFRDHDYSVSIANNRDDELGALVTVYNDLAGTLRKERFDLFQRELLLDTVIQSSSVAVIITNLNDVIVFSNRVAREFLDQQEKLEGARLSALAVNRSQVLSQVIAGQEDGLFTLDSDRQPEVFHMTFRRFNLNAQIHHLFLFKQLTREIARQEVETWKKVIRVISHELNNSLAPIASLTRSARMIVSSGRSVEKLDEIFASIGNRTEHLHQFIEQYARFARLPKPKVVAVNWPSFLAGLQKLCRFSLVGELPERSGSFDPVLMEQVLINLVKNAHESGSAVEAVCLRVIQDQSYSLIAVEDRGPGMSADQMELALLPFYSTKRAGSGLGLPLCREVVELHGGTFQLFNREGGGIAATCKLPLIGMD